MTADAIGVSEQWRLQAIRDLEVARSLAASRFYEWASYAAQQAAEKAIKGLRHALAIDTRNDNEQSHKLIQLATPILEVCPDLLPDNAALGTITQHEADGRYPGLRSGTYRSPNAVYTEVIAFHAVLVAQRVVERCSRLTLELQGFWAQPHP